jgi:hypothetical protein
MMDLPSHLHELLAYILPQTYSHIVTWSTASSRLSSIPTFNFPALLAFTPYLLKNTPAKHPQTTFAQLGFFVPLWPRIEEYFQLSAIPKYKERR